jgi:hypothetical protein
MGENIAEKRKPGLLGDEVDELPWRRVAVIAQIGAHSCVFD